MEFLISQQIYQSRRLRANGILLNFKLYKSTFAFEWLNYRIAMVFFYFEVGEEKSFFAISFWISYTIYVSKLLTDYYV